MLSREPVRSLSLTRSFYMPCTDENICFGSLQSTVKGFILFPFADRSFRLFTHRYRFCNNIIGTCIMLSCVFDKNTRGQYKHWQTHTHIFTGYSHTAHRHSDSVSSIEADFQMNRYNTSNDENVFIDNDDGNH